MQILPVMEAAGNVWILDLQTRGVTQITRNEANDVAPTWSPDGKEIAFLSARKPAGVYAVTPGSASANATADKRERLLVAAEGNLGTPSWTPDGNDVVYSVSGGGTRASCSTASSAWASRPGRPTAGPSWWRRCGRIRRDTAKG